MNDNYTHISVLIDRSGSMSAAREDTIGGYNEFLRKQRTVPGKLTLTQAHFDHEYILIHDFADVREVSDIDAKTYVPRGMTALLDSLGRLINDTGARLSALPEAERPCKVIVLVITDGVENRSQEFTLAQIKEMIAQQESVYSWEFVYLGADPNSMQEAASMGFNPGLSATYSLSSTGTVYTTMSDKVLRSRTAGTSLNFTDDERKTLVGDE